MLEMEVEVVEMELEVMALEETEEKKMEEMAKEETVMEEKMEEKKMEAMVMEEMAKEETAMEEKKKAMEVTVMVVMEKVAMEMEEMTVMMLLDFQEVLFHVSRVKTLSKLWIEVSFAWILCQSVISFVLVVLISSARSTVSVTTTQMYQQTSFKSRQLLNHLLKFHPNTCYLSSNKKQPRPFQHLLLRQVISL